MSEPMQPTSIRRVITGHDAAGKAVLIADEINPHLRSSPSRPGVIFHNLWTTSQTPAPINAPDPVTEAMTLPPPANGSNFRIVEFGPERDYPLDIDAVREGFAEMGNASDAVVEKAHSKHAAMHRTKSVDYGIVLEGEIVLIMDEGETTLKQGDVCIQRGTNHAWSNRSDKRCLMAFVLLDGEY